MALEITCSNVSLSLPAISTINNQTIIPNHSYYNPNGKAIAQMISSSLARSTFSIVDVRSFLKLVTSDDTRSWDVSTVVSIKPITSTIIYSSVILAVFILLSLMFYIISCSNCCKRKSTKRRRRRAKRKCSGECVCIVLIFLIGLIVVGQMIYIAYQVNRTRIFLDDSIKEINQEIYPKEISFYLNDLLQQFESLDQYLTQRDSIVINASRSLLVKAFDRIFREQYFLDIIRQSVIESDVAMEELNELIDQETNLLPGTILLFEEVKNQHREMIEYLKVPLEELCMYANGSETDIDGTIFHALDPVHQQLAKLIDAVKTDFLPHITPWQNAILMDKNLEDKVRWYIRLVGILLLVLIIIFGLIPIVFFIIIIVCRQCHCQRKNSLAKSRIQAKSSTENERSMSSGKSSDVIVCWMRIVFIPMIIMLIIIVLLSGVLYGIDLFTQGACRTVHDDQSFLVSFLIDELLGTNSSDLIIGESDLQTTVITIIDDCRNQIHFSEHVFENHLGRLENDVTQAMDELNNKIDDKFNTAIDAINIRSDLDRLDNFSMVVNSTTIREKVKQIIHHLEIIETQFKKITASIPILPPNVVNQTIDDFKSYVTRVLELTVYNCPLPLATMYKADKFVCHNFATSINGLWFSLLTYMFFIIFGLCNCGLYIYKRLQSVLRPYRFEFPGNSSHRF